MTKKSKSAGKPVETGKSKKAKGKANKKSKPSPVADSDVDAAESDSHDSDGEEDLGPTVDQPPEKVAVLSGERQVRTHLALT